MDCRGGGTILVPPDKGNTEKEREEGRGRDIKRGREKGSEIEKIRVKERER